MPKGMQVIYTQNLTSGAASTITFNNIPQTFDDLLIVGSARTTETGQTWSQCDFRVNGISSTIYSKTSYYGYNAGTTGTDRATNQNAVPLGWFNAPNSTANIFGYAETLISNYSKSGIFKSVFSDAVTENNSTGGLIIKTSGLIQLSSPITSITLINNATWTQHSSFTIYGIAR